MEAVQLESVGLAPHTLGQESLYPSFSSSSNHFLVPFYSVTAFYVPTHLFNSTFHVPLHMQYNCCLGPCNIIYSSKCPPKFTHAAHWWTHQCTWRQHVIYTSFKVSFQVSPLSFTFSFLWTPQITLEVETRGKQVLSLLLVCWNFKSVILPVRCSRNNERDNITIDVGMQLHSIMSAFIFECAYGKRPLSLKKMVISFF